MLNIGDTLLTFSSAGPGALHEGSKTALEEAFGLDQLTEDDLYSAAAYLVRRSDGKVLLNIHGEELIWPASMTKLMTAYLGVTSLSPDQEITLPEEVFGPLYAATHLWSGSRIPP